jgi:hypothetical protein
MPKKASPLPVAPESDQPDLSAPFDEATRPVSLQLIARLAAQDPTVQLKIGVIDLPAEEAPFEAAEEHRTGK